MANSAVVGVLRALLMADTAQFDQAMKRSADSARVWSRDLKQIGAQATQVGTALTKSLTLPLVALAGASAKAAIDFESSFAGVRKTVNATEPEFKALEQAFRDLAKQIPISVNELNKLGEAAGALGIPKAEIVKFTEVMALLGVTTNVTAEEAATSIAQIQNVFQAAGKDSDRFASALVDLGNKGASTEKDILSLANRLASAGRAINLSQADVLGFAAALANVGIEAEAGGTAMSKVFADISMAVSKGGKDLDEFAATARMSTAQFSKLFKEDAATAVTSFIAGLGKAKAEGKDLNLVLNELGFTEVRQARALRDLALSGENLATSIKTSNDAWSENAALSKEAAERFKTTESQLTLLWNRIKDVGITIGNAMLPAIKSLVSVFNGLLPIVDTLAKGFALLPGGIQLSIIALGGLVAAAGPVLFVAGQLITSLGTVVAAFAKGGIGARALQATLGTLQQGLAPLLARVALMGSSITGLGSVLATVGSAFVAFLTGPIGLAVVAIGSLVTGLRLLTGSWDFLLVPMKFAGLVLKEIAANVLSLYAALWDKLKSALTEIARVTGIWWSDLTGLAGAIFDTLRPAVLGILDPLGLLSVSLGDIIKDLKWIMANAQGAAIAVGIVARAVIKNATGIDVGATDRKRKDTDLPFEAPALSAGLFVGPMPEAVNRQTAALKLSEEQLKKNKEAADKLKKAAEELARQIDAERKSLDALGLTTLPTVVDQFGDLNKLWSRAVADGVPLETIIKALGPAYQKLADKAKESHVELKALNETIALQKRILGAGPSLSSLPIGGGTESLMKVGVVLKDITAASLGAQAQQIRTNQAFEAFGLKTPAELAKVAQAARDHFRALQESGLAAPEQLKAAWAKVLEAEREMSRQTVSLWKTQIFPAVKGVLETLTAAVNGSFAQMALGAKSFKEGFLDIWESIKSSILNIFNSIVSSFTNQFLKGILGALSGQGGAFSKAFGGLLGGVLGGGGAAAAGAIPGLATSTIGTGGGFAGAFGGGGAAAGLSGLALAGITAGIGAAIIAGFALVKSRENTTAKGREEFASGLGFRDLGALYKQLQTMGPSGQQLANQGLNVIGRKDEAANRKWMEDVTKFMEAVKNFASTVTSATGNIAGGFTGKISNLLQQQTAATIASYDQQIEAARENADEVKRLEEEKAAFIKRTQADIVANTQAEFDRISRITLGAFTASRAQGQSMVQAIQTVGPAIDSLKDAADRFGFAGNAAYEELVKWRELTTIAAPILDQTQGLVDLMKILGDVGRLDQQMFSDLQAQGLDAYQSLIDAGFTEKQAREAVRPLIEEEIRLAKEKNLKIDEGTQALINQMRANGELKGETKSLVDVFKEGFGALLKFLKVDLPAGWDATAAAGEEAAERTDRAWGGKRYNVRIDYETGDVPQPPSGFFNPEVEPGGVVVPGAQHGGIFTSPQIIGIGEAGPEAAIPLNRLRDFGIGTSLNNMYASIDVHMDGRRVAENQIQHLKFAAKRIGVRPI